MKKPFEVGERVICFDSKEKPKKGTIKSIQAGLLIILPDGYCDHLWYHPKQVRRLVKKERRRFWIKCDSALYKEDCVWSTDITNRKNAARDGWVEVVEVKKK